VDERELVSGRSIGVVVGAKGVGGGTQDKLGCGRGCGAHLVLKYNWVAVL